MNGGDVKVFGAEESRRLRQLAHAMRTEIVRDTFNRGKPVCLVIPRVDRYEAREFLEDMIHGKLPGNADEKFAWCTSKTDCETALARSNIRTTVFANADNLHVNIQEAVRAAHYVHPTALILVTEKHPDDLIRSGQWKRDLLHTCVRTYRFPTIDSRNRSDRERLFKAGVDIALNAFRSTREPRTSGAVPITLEADKGLLDLVAAHRIKSVDGAHAVLEWGRKCADLAIANGDVRLTAHHGIVALATPGEHTHELALATAG
jgi:hypothetical protein